MTRASYAPRKWRRRLRKAAVGLLAFTAIGICLVLVVLSTSWGKEELRSLAETQLRAALTGGSGQIGRIEGSVFGELIVHDLVINDADGQPAIRVEETRIRSKILPLFGKRLHIEELGLSGLQVHARVDPKGQLNLATLFIDDGKPLTIAVEIDELKVESSSLFLSRPNQPLESLEKVHMDTTQLEYSEAGLRVELGATRAWHKERGLDLALQGGVATRSNRVEVSLLQASLSGAQLSISSAVLDGNELAELVGSLVLPASAVQSIVPGTPWGLDSSLRFRSQGPTIALEGSVGPAKLRGRAIPPSQGGPAKISLSLSTIDLSTLWPGLPSLALKFQLEASHDDLRSQAKLKAVGNVLNHSLEGAELSVQWLGEELKAEANLRAAGASVSAHANVQLGEIPRIVGSELTFRSDDLARIATPWFDVQGDLRAKLRAEGRLDTVRVSGLIQSSDFRGFGLRLRGLTIRPDLTRRGDGVVGSLISSLLSLHTGTTTIENIHLDMKSEDGQSARVHLSSQGRGLGVELMAGLRLERNTLALVLERSKAHYRNLRLDSAAGRLRWAFAGPQVGLLSVEDLQVRSSAGRLSVSGAMRTRGRVRGKIALDARDIDLSALARALPLQGPLQGMLSMQADIDTRRGVEGDIQLGFTGLALGGALPLASGTLALQVRQRTMVASLATSMPGAADLNLNAKVRVPRNPHELSRWMRLDPRALLSLDGSASLKVSAFAPLNEALPRSGRVEIRLMQEEGTQEVVLDLQARKLRSSHVSQAAELDLRLALEATKIAGTARVSLGPKASARLASTLQLGGPWFASKSYRGLKVESIEALDLSTSEIDVDELLRNLGMPGAVTGAHAQARVTYAPRARSFETELRAIIPNGAAVGARVAPSLALHASVRQHEVSAALTGSSGRKDKLKLEGTMAMGWDELLRGTPNLRDVPISARLAATEVPLRTLREVLQAMPVALESIASAPEISGSLNLHAKLSGQLSAPEITAEALVDEVVVGGVAFSSVAADGSLQDGRVDVNVVCSQVGGGEMKMTGKMARVDRPRAEIAAQILASDFDLAFLNGFTPDRAIRGLLTANLQATGTREQPELSGSLILKKGSINPGAPLYTLKDAEIHAKLRKDKIVVDGKLRSGHGSSTISGAIGLVDSQPTDLNFTITTRKLPLAAGPVNLRLDSRSQLVGTYERSALKLALDIERATLNLPGGFARSLHPIDLPSDVIVFDSRIGLKEAESMPSVPMAIELAIRSKRNMLVKGGEANALVGVSLDLELGKRTQARGFVRVEHGWVEIVDHRYEIRTAAASFSGKLDPSLNVELAHEFDAITLFIDIGGVASKPVIELRSEPSIYDTAELLAFVLGASPDRPETDGSEVGQTAAGVATGLIAGQLSRLITDATPLDLLRIDTDDSSAERVILGKWITEKLLIAYRHRFTNDPKTNSGELVFEYRLLKRWLLEGFIGQQVIGLDALWIRRY